MKNIFTLSTLTLLLFFCVRCNKPHFKSPNQHFTFQDSLSVILDAFIQKYPNKKIYELYIDKRFPNRATLMLFARDTSRTFQENTKYNQLPLIKVPYKGKYIYVYSGVERYIQKSNGVRNNRIIADTILSKVSYNLFLKNGACWVIVDNLGVRKVLKDYDYTPYPFSGTPLPFKPVLKPKINQNPDTTNK